MFFLDEPCRYDLCVDAGMPCSMRNGLLSSADYDISYVCVNKFGGGVWNETKRCIQEERESCYLGSDGCHCGSVFSGCDGLPLTYSVEDILNGSYADILCVRRDMNLIAKRTTPYEVYE